MYSYNILMTKCIVIIYQVIYLLHVYIVGTKLGSVFPESCGTTAAAAKNYEGLH
jgi:hypothetical protein